MKTYYKFLLSIVFLIIFSNSLFSQRTAEQQYEELRRIYKSLEYNTIAFDDLKSKWIITDPLFIREVFNKFVVKNAIRLNDKNVKIEDVQALADFIANGHAVIELRQRYYDKEIEYFAFISESELTSQSPKPLFDPVVDGYYLRDVLGRSLYNKIQDGDYALTDITKDEYDTKVGYFYDLNLNILEPKIMFWSTTSGYRNKYLLSFTGKWGNDYIAVPGWNLKDYIFGMELAYYDNISSDPNDYTYHAQVGLGNPSGVPYKGTGITVPLKIAYRHIYMKVGGDPLKFLIENHKYSYFFFEAYYAYEDLKPKQIAAADSSQFYGILNYFVFGAKQRKIFNLFDFGQFEAGLGVSLYDEILFRNVLKNSKPTKLKKETPVSGFLEVGVSRTGGLLQHNTSFILTRNFTQGITYAGAKIQVMLNGSLGFDFRILNAFGFDKKTFPKWRMDNYMVFSPIIRINY